MKTHLVFGLYDILLKGKHDKKPDTIFMSELVDFANENNKELYLITGLDREKGETLVKNNGLDAYFKEENICYIEKEYYETLSNVDKELKEKAKEEDPYYSDDYYKVHFFNKIYKGPKDKTLFIGHDVWTDAYYLSKYSDVDVVLLKDTLANNSLPHIIEIKDLHVIEPKIETIKEYLEKEKIFNYEPLHTYAEKLIYKKMVGGSLFNTKHKIGSAWTRKQDKMSVKEGDD
jgi:formylmethanofuran dehydrogenase subunit D